jgi:glucosamine-6-phosphate deaminase
VDTKILSTREDVAQAVAMRIAHALREKPDLVLGLPAGQTPVPVYAALRALHRAGDADFSRATCFLIDEFVGLERTDSRSFYRFVADHLFSGVNVRPDRQYSLDGSAHDLDAECERYESGIRSAGGIDVQMLGLGRNGHVGFNEPADDLIARTHRVSLHPGTRRDNAARFNGDPAQVPAEALSMGMGTILKGRAIVMIATGESKAKPVDQMIRGPVTTHVPASLLQLHANVEVYLDRAAASQL